MLQDILCIPDFKRLGVALAMTGLDRPKPEGNITLIWGLNARIKLRNQSQAGRDLQSELLVMYSEMDTMMRLPDENADVVSLWKCAGASMKQQTISKHVSAL